MIFQLLVLDNRTGGRKKKKEITLNQGGPRIRRPMPTTEKKGEGKV